SPTSLGSPAGRLQPAPRPDVGAGAVDGMVRPARPRPGDAATFGTPGDRRNEPDMISTTPALLALALLAVPGGGDRGAAVTVTAAKVDAHGFLVHEVRSPYQAGTTHLRVLLPDRLDK